MINREEEKAKQEFIEKEKERTKEIEKIRSDLIAKYSEKIYLIQAPPKKDANLFLIMPKLKIQVEK